MLSTECAAAPVRRGSWKWRGLGSGSRPESTRSIGGSPTAAEAPRWATRRSAPRCPIRRSRPAHPTPSPDREQQGEAADRGRQRGGWLGQEDGQLEVAEVGGELVVLDHGELSRPVIEERPECRIREAHAEIVPQREPRPAVPVDGGGVVPTRTGRDASDSYTVRGYWTPTVGRFSESVSCRRSAVQK